MGRGRGKAKRLTVNHLDDPGSGEEEKIPAQKRRGRPQKPLKDDIDEEELEKLEEDGESRKPSITTNKEAISPVAAENGKRKRYTTQTKEKPDSIKEENGVSVRSTSTDDSMKSNGFRHNGSRRKSKPRRAAEATVECK